MEEGTRDTWQRKSNVYLLGVQGQGSEDEGEATREAVKVEAILEPLEDISTRT